MNISQIKKNNFAHIPMNPGIYLFYNKKKELIYVGKATTLKNRVRSYFTGRRTSRPIEQMIHEVRDIKTKETDSVLEALLLEGRYIKKYRPKYNVDWKDDKTWNYVVITNGVYPQVKTLRAHEYQNFVGRGTPKNFVSGQARDRERYLRVFGPYPGMKKREVMKILKRLFFISTCKPLKQSKQNRQNKQSRPCLYRQMGQCLGVCTGEILSTDYKQKVIKPLMIFLSGGKKHLLTTLRKRMTTASKQHDFEEAARLRNQIFALQRIQDVALLNESFFTNHVSRTTYQKNKVRDTSYEDRVEGYDISNFGDTGKVGSMVVFEHGEPNTSEYRKFKIRWVDGQSDVACIEEIIIRRLNHREWPLPQVFLVDGGKPQVNRVKKILREQGIKIPVVGIAKGSARKKNEFILGSQKKEFIVWVNTHQELLIRVRDEAHRFAIQYQKKLRKIG